MVEFLGYFRVCGIILGVLKGDVCVLFLDIFILLIWGFKNFGDQYFLKLDKGENYILVGSWLVFYYFIKMNDFG